MSEDSQLVGEVQFSEGANGQSFAQGVNVNHGEAGTRLDMGNGRRRIAGGGNGNTNQETIQKAQVRITGVVIKCRLPTQMAEMAVTRFKDMQGRGFCRGRSVDKVAGICLYWAARRLGNTPIMLIDIADALGQDVFSLGKTFKKMLESLYGKDEFGNYINCPFEPIFPEDLIKHMACRLGFYDDTGKVQEDAVRIVQRMDRDWIVLGRKPNGICGSAVIIAARMNNYRRTATEVAYVAKTTKATLQLRLNEFARVRSAQMSVADFKDKDFIPESHDPPAFYRQSKEYQEEQEKKKAARKRKRGVTDEEGEEQTDSTGKKQRTALPATEVSVIPADDEATLEQSASAAEPAQSQTDADGFVIPPLPRIPRSRAKGKASATQAITEDDISEAVPTNNEDEEDALASKYGDVPLPDSTMSEVSSQTSGVLQGAKTIRKNRVQGSSLKDPLYLSVKEQWEKEEEEAARILLKDITNAESAIWVAAAKYAGVQKQDLMEKLESARPISYQQSTLIDAPDVTEDEFADDLEVLNCLLTEKERKVKERLWLNQNKDWLREQQEKEYKAKTAPPKKPRKNPRKPRIGEGQLTPASSAGDAAVDAAKRLQFSSRVDYSRLQNMFSGTRGPGSVVGSEITSQQTSRAGSEEIDDSDSDEVVEEDTHGGGDDDDDDVEVEDYDEQYNEDDGEEFGGGGGGGADGDGY